jgi:hypothetical protein
VSDALKAPVPRQELVDAFGGMIRQAALINRDEPSAIDDRD